MQPTPLPPRVSDLEETAWWDFWNTKYRSEDGVDAISTELFKRVAQAVGEVLDPAKASILEIGCGSGTLSRMLRYAAYRGVDISPAAIEVARTKGRSTAVPSNAKSPQYEAADFHDWPVPPDSFDLLICVDAVAYFRDQKLALRKMALGLRPGGKLLLTTINPFVYNRIKRTSTSPIQEGAVSHWLKRAELHSLVESAGFSVERSRTIMPRGNRGVLRIVNSAKLDQMLGKRLAPTLKRWKESAGLGQYQLVVARKSAKLS